MKSETPSDRVLASWRRQASMADCNREGPNRRRNLAALLTWEEVPKTTLGHFSRLEEDDA